MSDELQTMTKTGSRGINLSITKYFGGKKGTCLQLGGDMEEGGYGYIQLNKKDMIKLIRIWEENIGSLELWCEGDIS